MSDNPEKPYEVGYGRPPAASRFKAGESGNRKGRPKGSKNFSNDLQKMLDTHVTITEGGKRKKVTLRKAAAKQVAIKAAGGDPRAIAVVREEDARIQERLDAATSSGSATVSHEDELVVASIIERIRRRESLPASDPQPSQMAGNANHSQSSGQKDKP